MFKLRVSNTLLSLSMASVLFGPGICVFTIGALGSSGKKDCSPLSATAAAAVAYCLVSAIGAFEVVWVIRRGRSARERRAVRRRDAIVYVVVVGVQFHLVEKSGSAGRRNVRASGVSTTTQCSGGNSKLHSGPG